MASVPAVFGYVPHVILVFPKISSWKSLGSGLFFPGKDSCFPEANQYYERHTVTICSLQYRPNLIYWAALFPIVKQGIQT